MAFVVGYATVAFADLYNTTSQWIASTTAQKELALSYGRMYIDSKYFCVDSVDWDTDDETTIPDEVKLSNSIIAEKYILGELSGQFTTAGLITKKKVKADTVEVETTYQGANSTSVGKKTDYYREVTTYLSPYCVLGNQQNLTRV